MRFIDPPSPFASLQEWEEFLQEIRGIHPKDDQVREMITEAEQMIEQKKSGLPPA